MTDDQDAVRLRIQHEVENINARLTWMLTFQGFLFAGISIASGRTRTKLVHVLPWAGLTVALLSILGIAAAYTEITAIRHQHPEVTYGASTDRLRKYLGRTNSFGIPVVVAAAWLWLHFELT